MCVCACVCVYVCVCVCVCVCVVHVTHLSRIIELRIESKEVTTKTAQKLSFIHLFLHHRLVKKKEPPPKKNEGRGRKLRGTRSLFQVNLFLNHCLKKKPKIWRGQKQRGVPLLFGICATKIKKV